METDRPSIRSGTETRQRRAIIGFRATAAERAELEAAAERAGLSLSSYVRAATLTAPETRAMRRATIERDALAQLLARLGRISGNVYQISRRLNFNEMVEADIPTVMAEVKAAGAAILQALGRDEP
jgi:uncharacterized protein (DUF1778 family)